MMKTEREVILIRGYMQSALAALKNKENKTELEIETEKSIVDNCSFCGWVLEEEGFSDPAGLAGFAAKCDEVNEIRGGRT